MMSSSSFVEWFLKAVTSHSHVKEAVAVDDDKVRIVRDGLPTITAVPVTKYFLDTNDVAEILAAHEPTLIVLAKPGDHYSWEAKEYAVSRGASLYTMKELFTFLPDSDPRGGVDKNVTFILDRLRQHSKVIDVSMICESYMRIDRMGALDSLRIAVEYHYEFTDEALVGALGRHGDADIIYNANPNGKVTQAAHRHADTAGIEVLGFGELMSRLHER